MRNDSFDSFSSANGVVRTLSGVLLACLLTVRTLAAEPVRPPSTLELPLTEAHRNANGNRYQVGDRITLTAQLPPGSVGPGDSLVFSEDNPDAASWYRDPRAVLINGGFRFIVSPLKPGELELPRYRISKEGSPPFAHTGPYRVTVTGPTPDPGQQPGYIPVLEIKLGWAAILGCVVLALALLSGIGYGISTRRKRASASSLPPAHSPPPEPADRVATRKIEALFQKHPFASGEWKPLCFGCSETLKNFFSERFQVDASESTTAEMLQLLQRSGLDRAAITEIETLFETLDLVKFTREEHYRHLNEVDHGTLRSSALLIIARWRQP